MIKVGIIGTGSISSRHIEGYLSFGEECRIVAVSDIEQEKAREQAERVGLDATVYSDHQQLLSQEEVDLVSICTPPSAHAQVAIDCLEAGVHVLVEKPMAASLAECDAMIAAAEKSGRLLSVVAQNRYRTTWMKLKTLLDEKIAGEVLHAQIDSLWWRGHSYYDLWWRGTWESEGGGPTLNHAVHHIDALAWMMGLPVEVEAMMSNVAHDNAEVEDLSIALLRFENGSLGQITSSVVHHGQEQGLTFQCEHAKLAAPWSVYASRSRQNGFPERDEELEATIERRYAELPESRHENHTGQIENVLAAVRGDGELLIDGSDGRKTLELIQAIYKSGATRKPVALPLPPSDPFYSKEGLLSAMPRYHEKTGHVRDFNENRISTREN